MDDPKDPDALAERIDTLLGELRGDARAGAVAEDLVRTLMQFYGAAFARTLDLIAIDAAPVVDRLAADPLVGSVMLLHDLHPVDRDRRIAVAIDRARAVIDDPDAALSVVESDGDRLRVRLTGASPAATAACRNQVLRIIRDALPEITDIDLDTPAPPVTMPIQLCRSDGTPVTLPHAGKHEPDLSVVQEERTGA